MKTITAKELHQKLEAGEDIQLIDVREPNENAFARIEGAKLIPLGEVVRRMDEIDASRDTVVHCKGGVRSAKAIEALQQAGFQGSLTNLTGGILAWSSDVDPSVPKY
ncbi:MAG: molybdopterin and thiamine biosynthesis family dinucleotide-utilizing protein [Acidobacteria bacterium OLB17]|nr:MAG: molybdopterin and thiamine biosynthesis family dinucleotide-utilizing protein [Acidobacteria bacterium OLB17]MCZ2389960.1 rhodanese-like domain-containing protein [Acidobacteriota bacterium]